MLVVSALFCPSPVGVGHSHSHSHFLDNSSSDYNNSMLVVACCLPHFAFAFAFTCFPFPSSSFNFVQKNHVVVSNSSLLTSLFHPLTILVVMDKQDSTNPSPPPIPSTNLHDSPPPRPTPVAIGDRLKRDEWSEGAVSTLLEAYETKWVLRNRAKLKGHDWEDVARFVSSRANGTKSPKTQTQCKNKIESMKKRYRSESAIADSSSWPLYPRLDTLLRGTPSPNPVSQQPAFAPPLPSPLPFSHPPTTHPLLLLDPPLVVVSQPPVMLPGNQLPLPNKAQNSPESNGADRVVAAVKEDGFGLGTKIVDRLSDKNHPETDSSTPVLYSDKQQNSRSRSRPKTERRRMRKRKGEKWEIGESIRWLGEVVVRSEQLRMETMKEMERMRMEGEARRGEMELKRTEIVANTQLEIAKIFAASVKAKGIDPSLRIG